MNLRVTYFVGDQKRAVTRVPCIFAADRSALLIKERSCALQRGVRDRQKGDLKIEMVGRCRDERQGIKRIRSRSDNFLMKAACNGSDRLETVHGSQTQQVLLLFVRQSRISYCILEALASIVTRFFIGFIELKTCVPRTTRCRKMSIDRSK